MFIKELKLYIDFLKNKIEETKASVTIKEKKSLFSFVENLKNGIQYYDTLFSEIKDKFEDTKKTIFNDLETGRVELNALFLKI